MGIKIWKVKNTRWDHTQTSRRCHLLLPDAAETNHIDFVSSMGFAMGYLGGGLLFLFNVLMTLMPQKFGIADSGEAVRYAFITVAAWWGIFPSLLFIAGGIIFNFVDKEKGQRELAYLSGT